MKLHVVPGSALVVLMLLPTTGWAWGGQLRPSLPAVSYYYPPPVFVPMPAYPPLAWPVVPVIPTLPAVPAVDCPPAFPAAPTPPSSLFADPTPAPPSGAEPPPALPKTPPESMPGAGVTTEVRKPAGLYFNAYYLATRGRTPALAGPCPVTFWNLSSQVLTVKVDNWSFSLSPGQNRKLDLPRTFSWSAEFYGLRQQQIPAEEIGLEIVVRNGTGTVRASYSGCP
jgi:hypothetical protein